MLVGFNLRLLIRALLNHQANSREMIANQCDRIAF